MNREVVAVYDYRIANFDREGHITGLFSEVFKTYKAAKKELLSHVESQKVLEGNAVRMIQEYEWAENHWEAPPIPKPWNFEKPLYYTCAYTDADVFSGTTVRGIFVKQIRK